MGFHPELELLADGPCLPVVEELVTVEELALIERRQTVDVDLSRLQNIIYIERWNSQH